MLQTAKRDPIPAGDFKRALYTRGWTMRELAERWDITPEYMRRLAGDLERPRWFDDALKGIPRKGKPRKPRGAWAAGAAAPAKPREPRSPGLRYQGHLVVGSVVVVAKHLGDMADEDDRGLVIEILTQGKDESYRVIFERGGIEVFGPDMVDEFLVDTCIYPRQALAGYRWRGDAATAADFDAGLFQFHGVDEV
jgi:hypothetical protein